MTRFVFKSLIVAGAFLFFGGHLPLPEGRIGGTPADNLQMSLADPELIGLLEIADDDEGRGAPAGGYAQGID